MEKLIHILKRGAEWGTALRSKFGSDIFFRTTIYVVALQTGLVVVSIFAFAWVLHYTNEKVVEAVVSHLASSQSPAAFSPVLPDYIDAVQGESVRYVLFGIVAVAGMFGLLLAYATLRPARSSLEYQKLFISNVAHELRTPLSVIKTMTEVGLFEKDLPGGARKTFSEILEELERASGIINNLLSLNRLLRPERMEMRDVDLGGVIDRVVASRRKIADEYDIEIVVKKTPYRLVRGNAAGLEQVAANLLSNALQYTPRKNGGKITVTIEPDYKGSVTLAVADNGIGIAEKDLFHIFEPFYRADLSRTRRVRQSGSGLGLAIVSEVVRAHKGKINVQSAIGKGTTVSVSLPSGAAPDDLPHPSSGGRNMSEVSVDFSKGA